MKKTALRIREVLGAALEEVDAIIGEVPDGDDTVDTVVPETDDLLPRGTAIWFRRASRSNDRIPAVVVRHNRGWTMCGVTRYFTWAELRQQYLDQPLTWFSINTDGAAGENLIG